MLETDTETYVGFQVVSIPGGHLEIKELARNLDASIVMMMMMMTSTTSTTTIKFLIYLSAELNSQWPIIESAQIQTTAISQHRTKRKIIKTNKNERV
jgi:hypothetical protein